MQSVKSAAFLMLTQLFGRLIIIYDNEGSEGGWELPRVWGTGKIVGHSQALEIGLELEAG